MMKTTIVPLPGNENIADSLAEALDTTVGQIEVRCFPDGETYVRFEDDVRGQQIVLVCTLNRPDEKLLPLIFAAATARELGAAEVGLVAPYLAYMRQDQRFQPGEAVTSGVFAQVIDQWIDWLVTVDPHLHRRSSLSEIYAIPTVVLHAAPKIADWIRENIHRPVLIGPDGESEQWVSAVAQDAGAPFIVLEKRRHGDRDVEVSIPQIERWRDHTPVLVDDIISTARTMIETVEHLKRAGMLPPVCIGVHAIFAGDAYEDLLAAGTEKIVTCDTISHPTNAIGLTGLLAAQV